MIATAYCPLCGAASGWILFLLVLGVFAMMFTGTILLFWAFKRAGAWKDGRARFAALEAEERGR